MQPTIYLSIYTYIVQQPRGESKVDFTMFMRKKEAKNINCEQNIYAIEDWNEYYFSCMDSV